MPHDYYRRLLQLKISRDITEQMAATISAHVLMHPQSAFHGVWIAAYFDIFMVRSCSRFI